MEQPLPMLGNRPIVTNYHLRRSVGVGLERSLQHLLERNERCKKRPATEPCARKVRVADVAGTESVTSNSTSPMACSMRDAIRNNMH
jgi:hypothetical protein